MRREKRQRRIVIMITFIMLVTGSLWGRVFYLQLLKGDQYAQRAVAQRAGTYVYDSGRGEIVDRNERPLHARKEFISSLFIDKLMDYDIPAELLSDLKIEEEIRYSSVSLASHVTGYIKKPENPMQPQDGISGLERYFNDELWGTPSAVGVIIDATGKMVPGLGMIEWQYDHLRRPYNVITTLERDMQQMVETVGASFMKKGAVVILDPQSGDILAMASFPRLPVDSLYNGATPDVVKHINTYAAYNNRAIMAYPTGSVFKVIDTAAALEQGLQEPDGQFICDGSYELGTGIIKCFENEQHGVVDLHEALVESCNGYFVDLALRLGKKSVVEMANRFKLGQSTGIPLGGEVAGNIPTVSDLQYGGDLANMAIGQGDVLATPLQVARMMSIIANNGRDVYPRLVLKIVDKNKNTVKKYPVQTGTQVLLPKLAVQLRRMLEGPVNDPQGTARYAQSPLYKVVGKSGTAELKGKKYSHSWFAGIVDTGLRTLVAVVFVEEYESPLKNPAPTSATKTASAIFKPIMEAIVTAEKNTAGSE